MYSNNHGVGRSSKSSLRCHIQSNCIKINTYYEFTKPCSTPYLLLSNACHITNKIVELSGAVAVNNPLMVLIDQSWLSDEVPDTTIMIGNRYSIFRLDRKTPGGGGLLAYIWALTIVCVVYMCCLCGFYWNILEHPDHSLQLSWLLYIIHVVRLSSGDMKW